ncbi:MAG: hypothetical protein IPM79_00690 [Polyangiaceae bacterium]|nr:hypothetical protein [Polyangiaceae bacterium]
MTSSSTPQRSQSSGMPDDPVETAGPEYTVNPRAGGENDVTCAGKYLLIGVPQFAQDPISGNLMTSYLRLGASSTTWEQDPGGWLAAKIHEHGPPGGHLTPDNQEVDTTAETRSPDRVFIDDDRNRVAGVAHGLSKAERLAQSRVIHTRGGWRDHSDGNRITTTYGDKIEVIRGNYKRIVLGRQDEATSSAGWDVSGQIIQDFAYMMPGASVRVEESSNYKDASGNNVWHLQNTMENIVQSTNVAGDFFEYKWGNKHYSYTGSENPTDKGPNSYPRQNPHILEKTWATKIEGYTGSENKRIPEIYEETWATMVTSKEYITTKKEESTITTATSDTTVTTLTETTKVGAQVSTTFAGAVLDTTFVGAQNSTTIAGALGDITIAGVIGELTLSPIGKGSIEIMPAALELSIVGIKRALTIGVGKEWKIGDVEEIPIPNKKKVALNEISMSLKHTESVLMSDKTSVTCKTVALTQTLQAMQVYLGM